MNDDNIEFGQYTFMSNIQSVGYSKYIRIPAKLKNRLDIDGDEEVQIRLDQDETGVELRVWFPETDDKQTIRLKEDGDDE